MHVAFRVFAGGVFAWVFLRIAWVFPRISSSTPQNLAYLFYKEPSVDGFHSLKHQPVRLFDAEYLV